MNEVNYKTDTSQGRAAQGTTDSWHVIITVSIIFAG